MPDRKDVLKVISDEGCLLVLKCLFRAKRKREGWVDYGYIKDTVLAKKDDIAKVYDVLSEKPDIVKVHRSSKESPRKIPKATTEDYFVETQRLRSETQLNRAIKRSMDWDLVERRERKHKRKQKRKYEYRISEEGAVLYLKADLADHILECADFVLRCPESNMFVWSDEIMSYSTTPIRLIDGEWPSIPDFDGDVTGKLQEAIENFRTLWSMGHRISTEGNRPSEEEEPRVVIVLDFNPTVSPK